MKMRSLRWQKLCCADFIDQLISRVGRAVRAFFSAWDHFGRLTLTPPLWRARHALRQVLPFMSVGQCVYSFNST